MRVLVRLKAGSSPFNRMEGGTLKSYPAGSEFMVGQHVLENFKDRLEVVGEAPPTVKPAERAHVPGTDDDKRYREQQRQQGAPALVNTSGSPVTDLPPVAADPLTAEPLPPEGSESATAGADAPEGQEVAPNPPEVAPAAVDKPIAEAIASLATVGIAIDPALAKGWKQADLDRVPAVVARNGANLPKFILNATASKAPE